MTDQHHEEDILATYRIAADRIMMGTLLIHLLVCLGVSC
jgi:hypothetical protein